jgi:hypothetical protein
MGKYIDARNILLSFRTAQHTFLFQICIGSCPRLIAHIFHPNGKITVSLRASFFASGVAALVQ